MNIHSYITGFTNLAAHADVYLQYNQLYKPAMLELKRLRGVPGSPLPTSDVWCGAVSSILIEYPDHAASKKILTLCHLSTKQNASLEWMCDSIASRILFYEHEFSVLPRSLFGNKLHF